MKFLSAKQDLQERTLKRLPTRLARLQFLAEQRSGEGYEHWGLEREYGATAVTEALSEAHGGIFIEVLRAPMVELVKEAEWEHALRAPLDSREELEAVCAALAPRDLHGGSLRHLRYLVYIIKAVGDR